MFQLPAGRLGLRHWRKVHLNTNCPSRCAKILLQKTKTQLVQEATTHCKYLLQIHFSQFSNIYSKCHFHNDGLLSDFSYFLDFFLYSVQDPNFMHTEFQGPLTSPQFYDFWVISWQISQIYFSQKLTSFV